MSKINKSKDKRPDLKLDRLKSVHTKYLVLVRDYSAFIEDSDRGISSKIDSIGFYFSKILDYWTPSIVSIADLNRMESLLLKVIDYISNAEKRQEQELRKSFPQITADLDILLDLMISIIPKNKINENQILNTEKYYYDKIYKLKKEKDSIENKLKSEISSERKIAMNLNLKYTKDIMDLESQLAETRRVSNLKESWEVAIKKAVEDLSLILYPIEKEQTRLVSLYNFYRIGVLVILGILFLSEVIIQIKFVQLSHIPNQYSIYLCY